MEPKDIYVFNFDAKSWSKQSTSSAPDLGTGTSILDHDTNVFFSLPSGASSSLYQLDLGGITNAATGNAVAWEAVSAPSFQQGGGEGVVMAEASNHISESPPGRGPSWLVLTGPRGRFLQCAEQPGGIDVHVCDPLFVRHPSMRTLDSDAYG